MQGVEYKYVPVTRPDDELIDFIRSHTGKIRPLAEADLESYLALGIQLLNIGKPFYFEGIGAITKNQEGNYEFVPGEYSLIKLDEPDSAKTEKNERQSIVFEERHENYERQGNGPRKILIVFGILIALALIGWGGYELYKKNTYPENAVTVARPIVTDSVISQSDTSAATTPKPVQPDTELSKSKSLCLRK